MSGSGGHTAGSCPSLVYGQVDLYPALTTGHLANVPLLLLCFSALTVKLVIKRSRYQTLHCWCVAICEIWQIVEQSLPKNAYLWVHSKSSQSKFINLVHDNTNNKKLIGRSPLCLPNDHIIFVDDASQGAVFDGKAVAYDYTGSSFKPVETNPYTHTRSSDVAHWCSPILLGVFSWFVLSETSHYWDNFFLCFFYCLSLSTWLKVSIARCIPQQCLTS